MDLEQFLDKGVEELLKRHFENQLSPEERKQMMTELNRRYNYGNTMQEKCPNQKCNKPLHYTWLFGPACLHIYGGCGQAINIRNR